MQHVCSTNSSDPDQPNINIINIFADFVSLLRMMDDKYQKPNFPLLIINCYLNNQARKIINIMKTW